MTLGLFNENGKTLLCSKGLSASIGLQEMMGINNNNSSFKMFKPPLGDQLDEETQVMPCPEGSSAVWGHLCPASPRDIGELGLESCLGP